MIDAARRAGGCRIFRSDPERRRLGALGVAAGDQLGGERAGGAVSAVRSARLVTTVTRENRSGEREDEDDEQAACGSGGRRHRSAA